MRQQRRDLLAAGIAIVALTLGIGAVVVGRLQTGIGLRVEGDHLVVDRVTPYSLGAIDGVEPGMVVVSLNGTQLYLLPTYIYPEEPPADPNEAPKPIGVDPAQPTAVPLAVGTLVELADTPVETMSAIAEEDLNHGAPDAWFVRDYWYYAPGWQATLIPLGVGSLLLVGGWQLLRSGRLGASLQPLAAPLAVAVSTPFIVQPLAGTWEVVAIVIAGLLTTLAMLPLADGLWERISGASERRSIGFAVLFCEATAIFVTIAMAQQPPSWTADLTRWALVGAIPLMPGPRGRRADQASTACARPASSSGRLLQSTEFAVAGATPLMAVAHDPAARAYFPLSAVARDRPGRRPVHGPAARPPRHAGRSSSATSSSPRRRPSGPGVAADIHDDALQELTLLVRRLDAAGDAEGADIARTVSDRLRAICGDLRLPILDDLGVGPALDWLVLRIERLAGGEVRLERADGTRPPPDVELAFFRVAQEALANAVKHGQPPIVVRYHSTRDRGVALDRRRRARASSPTPAATGRRQPGAATSGCSTCSSGPRRSGRSSTSAAGRAAGPTSRSSGGHGERGDRRRSASRSSTTTRSSATGPPRSSRAQPGLDVVGVAGSLDEARRRGSPTPRRRRRPARHPARDRQRARLLAADAGPRRAPGRSSCSPRTTTRSTPTRRCGSVRPGSCSRPPRSRSSSTRSGGRPPAGWRSRVRPGRGRRSRG